MDVCKELLTFLKVASTYPLATGGNTDPPETALVKIGDAFANRRSIYLSRRQDILYAQLPSLALSLSGNPMERVVFSAPQNLQRSPCRGPQCPSSPLGAKGGQDS